MQCHFKQLNKMAEYFHNDGIIKNNIRFNDNDVYTIALFLIWHANFELFTLLREV